MEKTRQIKTIIEALLVVSEAGLSRDEIKKAIPDVSGKDVSDAIDKLKSEYDSDDRGFNLSEIAGRYRIVSKPEYMPWISNLYQKEPDRLRGPSLETLAIIAYKQPVTRAEVEAIRGVSVGGVIRTLLDKSLVEVRGRKDVIGRPLLYGTSLRFLEIFGLNSLSDLPALKEFTEEDVEYGKPQHQISIENEDDTQGQSAEENVEAGEDQNPVEVVDQEESVEESQNEEMYSDEPEKTE